VDPGPEIEPLDIGFLDDYAGLIVERAALMSSGEEEEEDEYEDEAASFNPAAARVPSGWGCPAFLEELIFP
jgi:hypothetical protein